MAYIGKQPVVGNFVKLDAITTSATTTFNLTNGGVAYFPQSANNCLVSLNGILQAPTDSYTISGSTIVFSSALTTSDVIDFIIVLGDVLNIGTPSDNTVSLAKLTATGTKDATTFLRGDNTFASAGATAGQVIQVVTATDTTNRTVSSTSFTSTTVSASITPASASNKVLVLVSGMMSINTSQSYAYLTVYRGATDLASTTNGFTGNYYAGDSPVNQNAGAISVSYLDSPSTTSSTTYTVYTRTNAGSCNFGVSSKQTITLLEVKG